MSRAEIASAELRLRELVERIQRQALEIYELKNWPELSEPTAAEPPLQKNEELLRVNLTWRYTPDPREIENEGRAAGLVRRLIRRTVFALLGPYLAEELRFRGTLVRLQNELVRRIDILTADQRELRERLRELADASRLAAATLAELQELRSRQLEAKLDSQALLAPEPKARESR